MEATSDRNEDVNKGKELVEHKAAEQTPAPGAAVTPRRGLRERGATRTRSGDPASQAAVNGATQGSGRVLRDRSTRAVPAWLKGNKSEEDEDENSAGASKRRKVCNSRRKKNGDSSGSVEAGDGVAGDSSQAIDSAEEPKKPTTNVEALPSRLSPAQSRAKPPSGRAVRSSGKPVCKTELGIEHQAAASGEANVKEKYDIKNGEEKSEGVSRHFVDKEDPQFQGNTNDLTAASASLLQGEADEEEVISSDEDVPFLDDLNDQSYDPKAEGFVDAPKPKRRIPPRHKDKKEKEKAPKKEEVQEIKMEGSDNLQNAEMEVKLEEELADDPDGPRKRGRRKKDDKTPRLPKRRKKPPVQYVRCEIEGCGTVLAHPRYLQHHIKYQHLLKKKYVCPHPSCGRLFRLQKQLLRHAKHHTDQRDYICEFCARAFKSSHNLAVHRMIHTGEKPLQCEICGFTCRQKASLNWHMKKHDADASYQFSCSICGKKFEKKDCVVAHKAKSHPEVLIAEALAANAGALITTPASMLELPVNPVQGEVGGSSLEIVRGGQEGQVQPPGQEGHVGSQVAQVAQVGHVTPQVSHQVVLLGQEQQLHTMQVPVTIALSPIDPPSPADHHHQQQQQTQLQLQMPVQFVQQSPQLAVHSPSVVAQSQPQSQLQSLHPYSSQQQSHGQIVQMTFQPVSQSQTPMQQIPLLATSQQLTTLQTTTSGPPQLSPSQPQEASNRNNPVLAASSPPANSFHPMERVGASGVAWEQMDQGDVLSNNTAADVQRIII